MFSFARQWSVSLLLHSAVLVFLLLFTVEGPTRPQLVQVVSTLTEAPKETDFLDLVPDIDEKIDLDASVSLLPKGGGGIAPAPAPPMPSTALAAAQPLDPVRERSLTRPLSSPVGKIELGGNVPGLVGSTVAAGGDAGSVDRITLEILRQLEKGKVLVCWLMDASGSLALRREQVIARFERIYKELDVLGKEARDALLTAIVAFGQDAVFMTPEPTADPEALKRAVREIKTDDSGKEYVFSAIKKAALKYRKMQTHGRRTLMLVVLTDEIGDDPSLLDDTVELVRRNRVLVYVLGPMAPFGRKEIFVPVVHEPTGITVFRPVERGPETVQSEHLSVPFWDQGPQYDLFPSGFGPYGLTRMARESGGVYFLYDDSAVPGPKLHHYDLMEYAPEYIAFSDYRQRMAKSPLRAAVVKAAEDSRGALGQPRMLFPAGEMNAMLSEAQKTAAKTLHFVDRALAGLRAVEKYRPEETQKRWQAHYDLMMGRLLATRVRCDEYNWALAQRKTDAKAPQSKDKNAWRLVGDDAIAFGKKEKPETKKAETNVKRSDPKATARAKEDAELAKTYLARVIEEHPGTPWALLAERELSMPLGFRWEEAYIEPPPKPGEPLTAAQKEQEEMRRKREQAEREVGKL